MPILCSISFFVITHGRNAVVATGSFIGDVRTEHATAKASSNEVSNDVIILIQYRLIVQRVSDNASLLADVAAARVSVTVLDSMSIGKWLT